MIINNVAINRETRANAIDNTTRTKNESFDINVYLLVDYKKFNLDLFIIDIDIVVENFIIRAISFEMLIIRYLSSVFFIANINI